LYAKQIYYTTAVRRVGCALFEGTYVVHYGKVLEADNKEKIQPFRVQTMQRIRSTRGEQFKPTNRSWVYIYVCVYEVNIDSDREWYWIKKKKKKKKENALVRERAYTAQ
jgi:hypothetical protein